MNLETNINLISPIDTIKIMQDLYKGERNITTTSDLYLKNLFDNKYFLYFVATKQNYRENIFFRPRSFARACRPITLRSM